MAAQIVEILFDLTLVIDGVVDLVCQFESVGDAWDLEVFEIKSVEGGIDLVAIYPIQVNLFDSSPANALFLKLPIVVFVKAFDPSLK